MLLVSKNMRLGLMSALLLSLMACGGGGGSGNNGSPAENTTTTPEEVGNTDEGTGSSNNGSGATNETVDASPAPVTGNNLRAVRSTEVDNNGLLQSTTVYEYDDEGNLLQTTQTLFEPNGTTVDGTATNTYGYDQFGRLGRVASETTFSDGTVAGDLLLIEFVNDESNNDGIEINTLAISSEDGSEFTNFVFEPNYNGDRVSTVNFNGFVIDGNELTNFDVDFTLSHDGPGRLISRVDRQFNSPILSSDDNVIEVQYQDGIITQLEDRIAGQSIVSRTLSRNETQDIKQSVFLGGLETTITTEYEPGLCLSQEAYLLQLATIVNLLSDIPQAVCRP